MDNFHSKRKEEILEKLQTSEDGISKGEAKERLKKYGLNQISKKKKVPEILVFLKQLNSPLIYILLVAMVISFSFHHKVDGYVILSVVLINATVGYIQERKAEKAIESLKKLIVSFAKVMRGGDEMKLTTKEVVPGDLILLEEGDRVPADAYLIQLKNFRTQESSLTGESLPVEKRLGKVDETTSLGDRKNMIFQGTLVVSGTAKAIVVSTGNRTEMGKIADSLEETQQPKIHFNEKVSQLSFQMAIFAIIGSSIIFTIGFFFSDLEFVEIFLFTIASLVSAIPEGLPAVLIIVLTVGARRMAKRNALIRHLPAVETLGVATVIATDKTGTITRNTMNVDKVITFNREFEITGDGWEPLGRFTEDKKIIHPLQIPILNKALVISAFCNNSNLLIKDGKYEITGDPTEAALLVLAKKASLDKEKINTLKIADDLSFSSELKLRATLVEDDRNKELYTIGAFEKILEKSSEIMLDGKIVNLNSKMEQKMLEKAHIYARQGMRVLGLAYKKMPHHIKSASGDSVNNMVFVALTVMKDPPRREVKHAMKRAMDAGIRVIMKTGDHKETAMAVAKEIGLYKEGDKVLTGEELDSMLNEEFYHAIKTVNVFARVTPQMKLKIVRVLQSQGNIVAMTGDGVNDAPALKRADIGISMGVVGTDVARESSELVLVDDNFATIVNAVEEGRIVFQNVRQTSFFLVTTNVAQQITLITSLLMKLPLPMLPIQILYLNMVTDTFNGMALSVEPGHNDVLNGPPRNRKERVLNKELIVFLALMAGLMVLGTIPLFFYYLPEGIEKARTIAFTTMSMFQLFNIFNMRSLRRSLFDIGLLSNKWIIVSLSTSMALMLGVLYIPLLSKVFQFTPLSILEFGFITLIASSVLVFGEFYKKFFLKPKNY